MRDVREAIKSDSVEVFLRRFLADQYPHGDIPRWVRDAANHMGFKLD